MKRISLLIVLLSLASLAMASQITLPTDPSAVLNPLPPPKPGEGQGERIGAPRTWDDEMLADFAMPMAGLGKRPHYASSKEYYSSPVDNLRTYPVFHPDAEPPGYWEWLQKQKPQPLVEPGAKMTIEEWARLGERLFVEMDVPGFRTSEPEIIAMARSREGLAQAGATPDKDGTIFKLRWVVTPQGVQLGLQDCAGCHTRHTEDGRRINGAPFNKPINGIARRHLIYGSLTFFPGDDYPTMLHRLYATPWVKDDVHERLKKMSQEEVIEVMKSMPTGTFARANGSPFFPNKVPDLIGFKDEKFLDHTATHQHRGPGDLMRYSAMLSYADTLEFGPHSFYSPEQRRIQPRYHVPDEALFAIAQYIYALPPPPNPHPFDAKARAGKRIFAREGCSYCHRPPAYTNYMLTPATGFTPPPEHLKTIPILNVPVGTDPGLALRTRKGTGYYKVPSLRGVWYRGLYLHDGSIASLEDLFDPKRLRDDYVPSGFKGYKVTHRAIRGHEYGLDLPAREREELIAFLRTL